MNPPLTIAEAICYIGVLAVFFLLWEAGAFGG